MEFRATSISGVQLVLPERIEDERGYFARVFCAGEFQAHGLTPGIIQSSVSFNRRRGTLRGLHFQAEPYGEAKVVRCTRGAIYDVAVDVRPGSPTLGTWEAFELTADNGHQLALPTGVAHGFQTLDDQTEVHYQMSTPFEPTAAQGYLFSSPALGITWPLDVAVISERDKQLPPFVPPSNHRSPA